MLLLGNDHLLLRQMFARLNELFDVKHIRDDLGSGGPPDLQVHAMARKLRRLLVTYHSEHFKDLANQSTDAGVIGISAGLSPLHH